MDLNNYIRLHMQKNNTLGKINTVYVTDLIKKESPFVFTKFGDGEFQCMAMYKGMNCDGDAYTSALSAALMESFIDLCEQSEEKVVLLGRWHKPKEVRFYCDLYHQYQSKLPKDRARKEIPFVNYHLIYNDDQFNANTDMYDFVQAVQNSQKNKCLIASKENSRLQKLFRAKEHIHIPSKCWFEQYDSIAPLVEKFITDYSEESIILIAGGLASKVLISKLSKKYPKLTLLDIGSGFDIIGKGYKTRNHKHNYIEECSYYKDLLPVDW